MSVARPTRSLNEDLLLARGVASGDAVAWEHFTETHSPTVLNRVIDLMRGFCKRVDRDVACVLRVIRRESRNGSSHRSNGDGCDDCMDSYLWFLEFLKGRIKAYRGENGCSLSTFVWALVHSPTTRIDWFRWKYGRVDDEEIEGRLPKSVRSLPMRSKKVFVLLRRRKSLAQMAGELGITHEEAKRETDAIRHLLICEGLVDLVDDPSLLSVETGGAEGEGIPLEDDASPESHTSLMAKRVARVLAECISELSSEARLVLRLRYRDELSAKDVADFARKTKVVLVPGKAAEPSADQVYYVEGVAFATLARKLRDRMGSDESIATAGLKAAFEQVGDMFFNDADVVRQR